MENTRRSIHTTLGIIVALFGANQAWGQTATVNLSSQKQYIRGFGGMIHIPWIGDLTAAERTLAFGNADGQLGFTILRIAVPESNTADSSYVASSKAVLAAGGLVFATPWNPPASMKSGGAIVVSQFAAYADHLNAFVAHMKSQGTELYAISVQNEPDYAAEWTKWTAAQCRDFIRDHGAKITTKLMSCESFNYSKPLYDPTLNDPVALENMDILGAHLYGTSVNNFPYALYDTKAADKERWMTEHYTSSDKDANLWPDALGVATEMHNSMVQAQFNAYVWWYIKRSYGPINNGVVTKRGWSMAQFSKFIRPGYYRVDATASPTAGVYLSAYKGPADVVMVAVNTNTSTKPLTISVTGSAIASYDRFTTSGSKNLAKETAVTASNGSLSVTLDAQSVTTLRGSGTVPAGGSTGVGGGSSTGGSSSVGGTSSTSGTKATGGGKATGGTTSVSTSSAKATGGAPSTGGTPSASSSTATTVASVGGSINAMGGSPSVIGAPGTGGSLVSAAGGAAPTTTGATSVSDALSGDDSGCGCTVVGDRSNRSIQLAFLGVLGALAMRSRKRRTAN